MSAILGAINRATDSLDSDALKAAEAEIKKHTGMDIRVSSEDVPSDMVDWMNKTGLNSLCTDDSWAFLETSEWNKDKIALWKERNIDHIVMTVLKSGDSDDDWITCLPEWESGSKTLKLKWGPHATSWRSDYSWSENGYKRWWNLADEIVFGLQLYQLKGKCFYKSDWVEDFEDVNPKHPIPNMTHKVKRWFQFRHWIIYWYPEAQWGWNWQWTEKPPKLPNGDLFNLDFVLSCPSLPNFEMPKIKLPSLDLSLPSLPSISAPSVSMPSLSMPSIGMPSMGSLPSMPDRKVRPKGKWACHGYIELEGLKAKADGKKLIISNAKVTDFWEKDGRIDTETNEHKRFVLTTTSAEQATSWFETLKASGVEEGDQGGCCTVA